MAESTFVVNDAMNNNLTWKLETSTTNWERCYNNANEFIFVWRSNVSPYEVYSIYVPKSDITGDGIDGKYYQTGSAYNTTTMKHCQACITSTQIYGIMMTAGSTAVDCTFKIYYR